MECSRIPKLFHRARLWTVNLHAYLAEHFCLLSPVGMVLILVWSFPVRAETPCSKELKSSSPRAYQWRGDYCEGSCSEDVSGEWLELVSMTRWSSHLLPHESIELADLPLSWALPPLTKRLQLSLRSLDPFVCYRLDAELPAEAESFVWHIDLAVALGLVEKTPNGFADIGFLLEATLENGEKVVVPVKIGPRPEALEMKIQPGFALSSLEWYLGPRDSPPTAESKRSGNASGRFFPADEPVALELECGQKGWSRLEVSATTYRPPNRPVTRGYDVYLDCSAAP